MYKRIVIVTRSGKKIFGEWYKIDEISTIPFIKISAHTMQDFNQLTILFDKVKLKYIDYSNWYVEERESHEET